MPRCYRPRSMSCKKRLQSSMIDTFQGYLVIHVNGYVTRSTMCFQSDNHPDIYYMNRLGWLEFNGWAVGDNERGRYCSRSSKKIRKFFDFDEAVAYIYNRKKKYKKEEFQLVYFINDGKQAHLVSTLDEIIAIDLPYIKEQQERLESPDAYNRMMSNLLSLGLSKGLAGSVYGTYLSIRYEGFDAARDRKNHTTWNKHISLLKKAGLTPEDLMQNVVN